MFENLYCCLFDVACWMLWLCDHCCVLILLWLFACEDNSSGVLGTKIELTWQPILKYDLNKDKPLKLFNNRTFRSWIKRHGLNKSISLPNYLFLSNKCFLYENKTYLKLSYFSKKFQKFKTIFYHLLQNIKEMLI